MEIIIYNWTYELLDDKLAKHEFNIHDIFMISAQNNCYGTVGDANSLLPILYSNLFARFNSLCLIVGQRTSQLYIWDTTI